MATRTTTEKLRRSVNLARPKVLEVLPEYFPTLYPNLVEFLEEYYKALEISGELSNTLRYNLFAIRELGDMELKYMDSLFYEIANGAKAEYFSDPRLVGELMDLLIHNRGTEYGSELFFRLFFGLEPEIQYPKASMLMTFSQDSSEQYLSKIGPEDGILMQDGGRYQVLSVLVKSGISFSQWEDLYRRFTHTAGFYLSSEVLIEDFALSDDSSLGLLNDSAGASFIVLEPDVAEVDALASEYTLTELAFHVESDGTGFVLSAVDTLDNYDSIPLTYIDSHYDTLLELAQLNSPTMDEDSDGIIKVIETSTTLERMDGDKIITSYNVDSV